VLTAIGSGLVTGWAIAVPIGAVGAFLVALTARTSYAVGAAAALGIATVDGGALFLGLTAVNPATVVYFAAIVLGNRELTAGPVEGTVFVLAAFAASASWQLLLAGGGAALGRVATGPRARRTTGLVSAAVVAGLAVHTMLS
jgi:arginine exporter protein ArgO